MNFSLDNNRIAQLCSAQRRFAATNGLPDRSINFNIFFYCRTINLYHGAGLEEEEVEFKYS